MKLGVLVVIVAWSLAFLQGTTAGRAERRVAEAPRDLTMRGVVAELERGEVVAVDGELLQVNAAGSFLTVRLLASTRIEGRLPAPGAAIRVLGRMDASTGTSLIVASELQVLEPPAGS